ncbi:ribosomal protein L30, ferredoxin-like fold domain-containing protein [Phascolomyces articulosus]|uniref:Ribosomal protein L30, ferredoxin-like fold domain-containing protein n=1 Tax=Phascolomyces articulosus TaxID=60185 RepID=A0AAD5JXQ9_9FUNG|nr:ribosomal protein L30, ferredoxin-like fold domain-containing protein [Phascolomyces articulosus]
MTDNVTNNNNKPRYSVSTTQEIFVPETFLKKQKAHEKHEAAQAEFKAAKQKEKVIHRNLIVKKAENYVREYRQRERDEIRLRRQAKSSGNVYIPAEPKLLFVVRIRGINDVHPKVSKILQLFRLVHLNNGVFVRLNKATANMLKVIEPYVTFGPPNLKTVRTLIYKRGFVNVDGQRIPITDNDVIQKNLGKLDVVCVEDIIHEIYTVGEHFKQVNRFLWPFKLNNPTGAWSKRKFKHYVEGGDVGDREADINRLVQSMV